MAQTREQIHEGLQICLQMLALKKAGKHEEAAALRKAKIPLPPYTAKLMRDQIGVEYPEEQRLRFITGGGKVWKKLA
ncbi:MAG: hypothetical protein LBR16_00100 [Treponema sp.]|nr:hypothetical protein [Treponema sp.]